MLCFICVVTMIIVGVDIGTHNKLLEGPCNLNVTTSNFFPIFLVKILKTFPRKPFQGVTMRLIFCNSAIFHTRKFDWYQWFFTLIS
jgi:hypothetical protein